MLVANRLVSPREKLGLDCLGREVEIVCCLLGEGRGRQGIGVSVLMCSLEGVVRSSCLGERCCLTGLKTFFFSRERRIRVRMLL